MMLLRLVLKNVHTNEEIYLGFVRPNDIDIDNARSTCHRLNSGHALATGWRAYIKDENINQPYRTTPVELQPLKDPSDFGTI